MAQVADIASLGVTSQEAAIVSRAQAPPRRGEILLVEDRNEVREGLAQLLELHGYMVTEARDADQATRELTAQPNAFALVVLDLLLGDSMTGVDFRLRQLGDPLLATVPTIVITATEVATLDR